MEGISKYDRLVAVERAATLQEEQIGGQFRRIKRRSVIVVVR